ncbi:AGE family epimerase/isomerase [Stappia sp. ICDLI1TA098]
MRSETMLLADLETAAERWRDWLFTKALPLWTQAGRDPASGAFIEAISLDGAGLVDKPRRGRVQPRQIYSVLEGGRLGWDGPWRAAALQALDWYLASFVLPDDSFADLVAPDGKVLDPAFDLYNQAFGLFSLANAARAFPEQRARFETVARTCLARLEETYRHPQAGFEEAVPPVEPLRANPHMHLLEAALAWEEVGGGEVWSTLSDEIMELALSRLIDGSTGVLHEFFDHDWQIMPDDSGRQIEPGHQFEWAWLALRWARLRGRADAAIAARRLFALGLDRGICPTRKVAVLEINADFSPRQPVARLWAQTEWIKAAIELADWSSGVERAYYLSSALDGVAALERFVEGVSDGLWLDKYEADGTFVAEPAPASSFYHIVCGISVLMQGIASRDRAA